MRPRRSVLLVLSCAAVAMTGCGGSSLLDGSTASDLQDSLGKVQAAIDEGRCSQARSAATAGAKRVDDLPSSVDADLRDRLKAGFDELSSRVGTDCTPTTTTETTPTVPTDTTPTDTTPTDTTPTETTTTTETTEPDVPTTPTVEDPPTTDPTDPTDPGDDGSGGVVPGVDGPGAGERSVPGNGKGDLKQRLKDLRKQAEDYFRGRGGR